MLLLKEDDVTYFVCSSMISEICTLKVTDCKTAWCGKLEKKKIYSAADTIEEDRDTLWTQVTPALDHCDESLDYSITRKGYGQLSLSLKKNVDDIKIRIAEIQLNVNDDCKTIMMDMMKEMILQNSDIVKNVQKLQKENQRYQLERKLAIENLEEFVQDKKEMEKTIYSKFLCVLNEKKRRIAELEDTVNNSDEKKYENAETSVGHASPIQQSDVDSTEELDFKLKDSPVKSTVKKRSHVNKGTSKRSKKTDPEADSH